MNQYGFDGADIDWEYPGADDRGGVPEDGENFTLLLQEMRRAFQGRYLLTFTAPTSYWYMRHFDIKRSVAAVDWVNLMSYDLHGVWDRENPIGNQVLGHSNLTEIDLALDLLWRNDVPPDKVVLGTGFYGRTFELEDTGCWEPGCPFSGPGEAGECTGTAGFLSYKGRSRTVTPESHKHSNSGGQQKLKTSSARHQPSHSSTPRPQSTTSPTASGAGSHTTTPRPLT
jgi:chitinase